MSTQSSTILKLRQAESRDITTNGSYNISLRESVLLETGDQVKIHSVFLDTTTESVVEIDVPTTITMEVAKYLFNMFPVGQTVYTNNPPYAAGPPVVGVPQPDYKRYWVCGNYGMGANDYHCTSVRINPHQKAAEYGDFLLTYKYKEVGSGKIVFGQQNIGQYHARSHPHGVTVPLSQFCQGDPTYGTAGAMVCTNTNLFDHNVALITDVNWGFEAGPVSAERIANLWTEELNFILPAGRYLPSEIAQIITDKMSLININGNTSNNYGSNQFLVDNPFLSSIAQLHHNIITSDGAPTMCLVPEVSPSQPTVQNILEFTAGQVPTGSATDYLIGANQTSMNYDETLKKLNYDILHFPRYVQPAAAGAFIPGVDFGTGNNEATEPLPVEPVGTYSGVAFTRLEPAGFWETLGFQNLILPTPHSTTLTDLAAGIKIYAVDITSTDGLNTTNAFLGSDLIVPKTADYFRPTADASGVATQLTTPIVSDREFDQVLNDEGYLLVEIGVKFPQKMIGGQSEASASSGSNKVQSIIGKYYTSSNFLQDSGAGSIVYEHNGLPQMLYELDVRVVHPDGTPPLENELGQSNSVFVEIIKTQNIQPPPTGK